MTDKTKTAPQALTAEQMRQVPGGASDYLLRLDGVQPGIRIPIKVKHHV